MKVNNDSIFIDNPNSGMSQNPPINEIGIPKETQNANFGLKNNASTMITRINPC